MANSVAESADCSKATLSAGFLKIVMNCNRFNHRGSSKMFCKPFYIEDKHVGFIRPDVIEYIRDYPHVFDIHENCMTQEVIKIQLSPSLLTFEERSEKVAEVLEEWRKDEELLTLQQWRDECYNVYAKFCEPPLMKMERSATCLFGVKQYGVHVNGYTRHSKEGLCMWIGKRAMTKPTWPGKLDQMVAGGLASGQTIMECARKESKEEASLTDELIERLQPVGTVSYFFEDQRGLFPECEFIMDLEMPEDYEPVNSDGETETFLRVPVEQLRAMVTTGVFKDNCALVVLDFFIRHGLITPDEEPLYTQLIENMHVTLL